MLPCPPDLLHVEIQPGWWLNGDRTLFLAEERALVVADIHWGYAQSHRRAGNLLPLWGNEATAERLRRLVRHYEPRMMIWLGDSLHKPSDAEAAEDFLEEIAHVEAIVIAGNHDRKWKRADRAEFVLGDYVFHHGHRTRELDPHVVEVIGHLHPAMSLGDGAGLSLKMHALVHGARRIVMPSFSDWSSGTPWREELAEGEKLWLISPKKIWPVTRAHF
jgi:putative SbcD/Mre11-related phosphoesterase